MTSAADITDGGRRSAGLRLGLLYGPAVFGVTAAGVALSDITGDLHTRLEKMGWQPRRGPHAMTVTLTAPPEALHPRFGLTEIDGRSHLVCTPGIDAAYVRGLLSALGTNPGGSHRRVDDPDGTISATGTALAEPVRTHR